MAEEVKKVKIITTEDNKHHTVDSEIEVMPAMAKVLVEKGFAYYADGDKPAKKAVKGKGKNAEAE